MFEVFDDTAVDAFIETVTKNKTLKSRINTPSKLSRLRSLGNIALEKASAHHVGRPLLELLSNPEKEPEFLAAIRQ
jgi:hypothetical protein